MQFWFVVWPGLQQEGVDSRVNRRTPFCSVRGVHTPLVGWMHRECRGMSPRMWVPSAKGKGLEERRGHRRVRGAGFPRLGQANPWKVWEIFSPHEIFFAKLGRSPGYPEGDPYLRHRAGTVWTLAGVKRGTYLGVSL